jgi:molybdopterin molybdotransferase
LVPRPERYASVGYAITRLSRLVKVAPVVERVETRQGCGRALADEIVSRVDLPPRGISHMDGYAVNANSLTNATEENPVRLRLKGEVRLGANPKMRLSQGEVVRVPTGGYLPEGANAVVPVESAEFEDGVVSVAKSFPKGSFVYPQGGDVRKGRRILEKGRRMRPQDVALLLSLGIREVVVYRRPRVAIIATGSELTDSWVEVGRGRILNSHGYVFSKFIEELGGIAVDLGVVEDEAPKIAREIGRALDEAEIVLTIGGTSLGSHDLVGDVLTGFVGRGELIHGIRMDRGRVAGVTAVRGKPVVMLPGPIQGAMNAFLLFVAPMIREIGGYATGRRPLMGTLTNGWMARKRFPHFTKVVYVKLTTTKGGLKARALVGETESMTLLTEANGYIIVPERRTMLKEGERVEVNLLPGFSYVGDSLFD